MGVEKEPGQKEPDKVDTSQFLTPSPGPALPGFDLETELEEGDTVKLQTGEHPIVAQTRGAIEAKGAIDEHEDTLMILAAELTKTDTPQDKEVITKNSILRAIAKLKKMGRLGSSNQNEGGS